MTLINFTTEELYKIMECINGDGDSYGNPVCESILDKIENLDDYSLGNQDNIFIDINNTGGKY